MTSTASIASIWLLDAVAAVVGLLAVASGIFGDASTAVLLALLIVSYLGWGFGLRRNLSANWRLLAETGISTSVLSKVGFELASRRGFGRRAVRRAAAVGYVIVEFAKEVPYYVGAMGTVAVSKSVDTADALIFLVGTNLGAAAYEYGLACLTGALLDRRSHRPIERVPTSAEFVGD